MGAHRHVPQLQEPGGLSSSGWPHGITALVLGTQVGGWLAVSERSSMSHFTELCACAHLLRVVTAVGGHVELLASWVWGVGRLVKPYICQTAVTSSSNRADICFLGTQQVLWRYICVYSTRVIV